MLIIDVDHGSFFHTQFLGNLNRSYVLRNNQGHQFLNFQIIPGKLDTGLRGFSANPPAPNIFAGNGSPLPADQSPANT